MKKLITILLITLALSTGANALYVKLTDPADIIYYQKTHENQGSSKSFAQSNGVALMHDESWGLVDFNNFTADGKTVFSLPEAREFQQSEDWTGAKEE